jgi:hypothetical protein
MKPTAKILKFKDKKLETVEEVRAALIAILEDIESGDATIAETTLRFSFGREASASAFLFLF